MGGVGRAEWVMLRSTVDLLEGVLVRAETDRGEKAAIRKVLTLGREHCFRRRCGLADASSRHAGGGCWESCLHRSPVVDHSHAEQTSRRRRRRRQVQRAECNLEECSGLYGSLCNCDYALIFVLGMIRFLLL